MHRRYRTFNRRLAWLLVAIAMLPLLLLTYLAVHAATTASETQAHARIRASADASATYVREQFRGIERLTEATAHRSSFVNAIGASPPATYDLPSINLQLREIVDADVGVHDISLFDVGGILRATEPPDKPVLGMDFSFRDYFRGVRATGRTYVSEAYISRSSGLHVVGVATPVRSQDGRLVGVLLVQIEVDETQAFVERFAAAQGVSLMVTDQRGAPVAVEGGAPRILTSRADDPRVARALRGEVGVTETGGLLSAYRPIPGLGWTISASIPAQTAYREASRAETLIVVCAAVLALAMLVALYVVFRTIHRYETRLQEQVDEVEHSNLRLEESNRKLQASNSALDTFSHTLAHDLRNPLTVIGGFAHTLRSVAADRDDQMADLASHIEDGAARMERLIEEVLELATLVRVAPERTEVDPTQVALEAAADIDGLDLELGPLPATISANRTILYRSFKNLLENAAAYGRGPDERAHVRISADETPEHWRFFIDDGGPGVTEADKRRILSPFQRGAQAAGRVGTGLGLAIVAASAESHGGSVHAEDAPGGVGARFVLTIAKLDSRPTAEPADGAGSTSVT
jgi:signal transduction histidine kinase